MAQFFPPNLGFPDSLNFSAKFEGVKFRDGSEPACGAALSTVYSNGTSEVLFFLMGTIDSDREWRGRVKTPLRMTQEEFFVILAVVQSGQDSLRCSVALDVTDFLGYYGIAVSAEDEVGLQNREVGVPYPNPATSGQDVRMRVQGVEPGRQVTASVHDVLGREVARIDRVVGDEIRFSTRGWASGMYFIRLWDATTAANDYAHAVQRLVVR